MGGSVVEYYFNYIKLSYICLCCIFFNDGKMCFFDCLR